jgi:hypothetical protein
MLLVAVPHDEQIKEGIRGRPRRGGRVVLRSRDVEGRPLAANYIIRKSTAALLAGLRTIGITAAVSAGNGGASTLLSHDGTVMQAPAIGMSTTAEGSWTFGSTARPGGDYALLLNGSATNGGWAGSLQVTNGNLYAFAKSDGHSWIRFKGAWVDIGTTVPVEGIFAAKVTITPDQTKTPDNASAGTILATVKVTMSRSSAPFTGRLVSSNPLFTFRGMNVVLARAYTPKDDGLHTATITALQ